MPKFILFSDNDRDLKESYDLKSNAICQQPPVPLRNLLAVAGSTVEDVWQAMIGGDLATMRTLVKRIGRALEARLTPAWNQSRLTIELNLDQAGLPEVNILELAGVEQTVTPISGRSDGLRTFLGLACFLIATNPERAPV